MGCADNQVVAAAQAIINVHKKINNQLPSGESFDDDDICRIVFQGGAGFSLESGFGLFGSSTKTFFNENNVSRQDVLDALNTPAAGTGTSLSLTTDSS